MSATAPDAPRVTTRTLRELKRARRPIVMVTAYDVPSARIAQDAGVDAILVGDSMGMTALGHASTLPVTLDDMVRACAAVSRAAAVPLLVGDMPFLSYHTSTADALRNAGRLVVEGGMHAVKVEGASPRVLEATSALVEAGIPVMGHVGLTPQSVNVMGGYRTQARDADAAARLIADAVALQQAGVFAVVLECIPAELAERVTALLDIPTIGIGAGRGCDGQVQVFADLVGLGGPHLPRHARRYLDAEPLLRDAIARYADDVRGTAFPEADHSAHMDAETLAEAEVRYGAQGADDGEGAR